MASAAPATSRPSRAGPSQAPPSRPSAPSGQVDQRGSGRGPAPIRPTSVTSAASAIGTAGTRWVAVIDEQRDAGRRDQGRAATSTTVSASQPLGLAAAPYQRQEQRHEQRPPPRRPRSTRRLGAFADPCAGQPSAGRGAARRVGRAAWTVPPPPARGRRRRRADRTRRGPPRGMAWPSPLGLERVCQRPTGTLRPSTRCTLPPRAGPYQWGLPASGGTATRTPARRPQRVHEQHRARHRPDAARHRRDRAGLLPARRRSPRRRRGPSSVRLVPTSITTAPSRTMSAVTSPGDPTAAISTSASRQTAGRSRVREWQCVTVAFAREQQLHERLADQDRAADHHRPRALQLGAGLAQQLHHAGGRAGHERLLAVLHQQAGVDGGEAVDVLGRVDQRDELVLVEVVRQRQLEQDAVHALVGVQRRGAARPAPRRETSPPGSWWNDSMPTSAESSRFMRT